MKKNIKYSKFYKKLKKQIIFFELLKLYWANKKASTVI